MRNIWCFGKMVAYGRWLPTRAEFFLRILVAGERCTATEEYFDRDFTSNLG